MSGFKLDLKNRIMIGAETSAISEPQPVKQIQPASICANCKYWNTRNVERHRNTNGKQLKGLCPILTIRSSWDYTCLEFIIK